MKKFQTKHVLLVAAFVVAFALVIAGIALDFSSASSPNDEFDPAREFGTYAKSEDSEFLLDGIYCPSITVSNEDGTINYDKWAEHLNHLADAGVNGVLLFGSIGEFYAYTPQEKIDALQFVLNLIGDRVDIMLGIGSQNMDESKQLIKAAADAGAHAVVSLPPFYFAPSDDTCVAYYKELAECADIPIVLYNYPDRTGINFSASLVARIAQEVPSVQGIKETVDTASHTRQVIAAVREVNPHFSVLSGFDEYYMTNRISGGNGVLSGLVNVEPETFVAMNSAYKQGDMDTAVACAKRIAPLMEVYQQSDLFISAIKGAVVAKGLDIPTTINDPAQQLTPQQLARIKEIVREG